MAALGTASSSSRCSAGWRTTASTCPSARAAPGCPLRQSRRRCTGVAASMMCSSSGNLGRARFARALFANVVAASACSSSGSLGANTNQQQQQQPLVAAPQQHHRRLGRGSRRPRVVVVAAAAARGAAADSYDGFDSAFSSGSASSATSSYDDGGGSSSPVSDVRAFILEQSGMVDFYALLGVDDDAPFEEIKRAYRSTAKECHVDVIGDNGHNICVMLNEAYEVLMDPDARAAYDAQLEAALRDEDDGYTGEPLSKWMPALRPKMSKNKDPNEQRAVFVDENTCIGCKQCVWHASAMFRIEPEHGRSRVYAQWLNTEDEIQSAIDSCPVSCIHWTTKDQLPALEFVMQNRVERVNVGIMMAGQGRVADVFAATEAFVKERRRRDEARALAARKYSPAQEAARREAAETLMRDHLGWFAPMFNAALRSMESTVGDGPSSEADLRVGRRKRAEGSRWQDRAARAAAGTATIYYPEDSGSEEYFLVPPERALVPVRASASASASPASSRDG